MPIISEEISESLDEWLILTDFIETPPEKVSLQALLGDNIHLQLPFITSRMQSVVGPKMAVAAGRSGILTMIPRSLRDKDRDQILKANKKARLKAGDVEIIRDPQCASPGYDLATVVSLVETVGHSVIPIKDNRSRLLGVYVHDPNDYPDVPESTQIVKVMHKLSENPRNEREIPFFRKSYESKIDKEEIKRILESKQRKFIPIVDDRGTLEALAFINKYDTNFIGIAINTRGNWEEEIEKYGDRVDTLCLDSSNACFSDAVKILKHAKAKFPDKPFGIGNIIQGRHFKHFAEEDADYIIAGMGVGSICKTGSERGNGRGQFTVARELAEARDKFRREKGRYVPLVLDGGIETVKHITVALAFGDFVMMGRYFNQFFEAAARKLDEKGKPTTNESHMRYVETWGEGHPRARLVKIYGLSKSSGRHSKLEASDRYGHLTLSGSTVEGVDATVDYRGRLKPHVEKDARYIKTTISNAGATDLESFRENAILEMASKKTLEEMLPHGVKVVENQR